MTACSGDLRRRALALGAAPARTRTVPYGVDAGRLRAAARPRRTCARGWACPTDAFLVLARRAAWSRRRASRTWSRPRPRTGGVHVVIAGRRRPARRRSRRRRARCGAPVTLRRARSTATRWRRRWPPRTWWRCLRSWTARATWTACPTRCWRRWPRAGRVVATRVAGIPDVVERRPQRPARARAATPPRWRRRCAACRASPRRARGWARRRARRAEQRLSWDAAARALRGVLCPGGGAGRPLGAPPAASTTRASALLLGALDLPAAPAFARAGCGRRRAAPLDPARCARCWCCGSTASATCSCRCPRSHDLRARAARGARSAWRSARWSEEIARQRARGRGARLERALGRPAAGGRRARSRALARKARALRARRLDLALDLQGDVRASCSCALTGARAPRRLREHRRRATCSPTWCRSTRRSPGSSRTGARWPRSSAGRAPGRRASTRSPTADRDVRARACSRRSGSRRRRPLVGRPPERRAPRQAVGRRALGARWPARLQAEFGADRARHRLRGRPAARGGGWRAALRGAAVDLTGRLGVRETMAVIAGLDLFLSPDTGPMHMAARWARRRSACSARPIRVRYFSGGTGAPARATWWCGASCGARPAT